MREYLQSMNDLTDEYENNYNDEEDKFAGMTDEEIDAYFRPKKSNKRKSLAPLFVYLILKEKSNANRRMRQQDILLELEKYPYEISIERKALSRIIHNLTDSQLNICSLPKDGTWYEKVG